jgi:hypothetical protein
MIFLLVGCKLHAPDKSAAEGSTLMFNDFGKFSSSMALRPA